MLRPLSTVVFFFSSLTYCHAQALPPTISQSQRNVAPIPVKVPPLDPALSQQVVQLLTECHTLLEQLSVKTRLGLLWGPINTMSQIRPELAKQWDEELVTLTQQVDGEERLRAQEQAVTAMAHLDPQRAREILHDMAPLKNKTGQLSPKMTAARFVFEGLAARDGASVMPLLEQEADLLALEGQYPYEAMMRGANEAGFQQRRQDGFDRVEHERALKRYQDFVQQALNKIVSRYLSEKPSLQNTQEFLQALQAVSYLLPPDAIRPALQASVKGLLATPEAERKPTRAQITNREGRTATADNNIDIAFFQVAPLVNRIDPELARQIQTARPQLKSAFEITKDGNDVSWTWIDTSQQLRAPNPSMEARNQAVNLARGNPDAAVAKAREIPEGDQRASTMLHVAEGVALKDPSRAAGLIAETPSDSPDDHLRLERLRSQASVAIAGKNLGDFRRYCKEAFEMFYQRDPKRTGINYYASSLESLVRVGAKADPEFTLELVKKVTDPEMKARLLFFAAQAVRSNAPIMGGYPNIQKPAPQ